MQAKVKIQQAMKQQVDKLTAESAQKDKTILDLRKMLTLNRKQQTPSQVDQSTQIK